MNADCSSGTNTLSSSTGVARILWGKLVLWLDEEAITDSFAILFVGIDVRNSQYPDAKTFIGENIKYSVRQVLSHDIILVLNSVLAVGHEFDFVLLAEQCLVCLRRLEIYSQRSKFAGFALATKIAPRAQADIEFNGSSVSGEVLKRPWDILVVSPIEHD